MWFSRRDEVFNYSDVIRDGDVFVSAHTSSFKAKMKVFQNFRKDHSKNGVSH